ncbi:MAG: nuclear transport factor 2 family protein [Gammaproteobacteria bacterium]
MSTKAVTQVVEEYVAACQAGSVERLQAVFHPNALLSGYMQGAWLMGDLQPFFDIVSNSPAPSADYSYQISEVTVAGEVASARLDEENYLGMSFTDFFHLAKVDDRWQIISKAFHVKT